MTTHRQHDAIEAAKAAQRERMVSAANRNSISPPEPPDGALGVPDYYDEPEPPETVKLDGPAAGRSADEEDAWRQIAMSPQAVARRDVERAALEELDELRLMALERDAIEQPRISREPVRPDPRPDWRDY